MLSRLLGKDVSLDCILRSEMVAAPVQSDPSSDENPTPPQPERTSVDEEERARVRIRAAMNIFDAEEIREPEARIDRFPRPRLTRSWVPPPGSHAAGTVANGGAAQSAQSIHLFWPEPRSSAAAPAPLAWS